MHVVYSVGFASAVGLGGFALNWPSNAVVEGSCSDLGQLPK